MLRIEKDCEKPPTKLRWDVQIADQVCNQLRASSSDSSARRRKQ
jgi:hypothetical protein